MVAFMERLYRLKKKKKVVLKVGINKVRGEYT